VNSSEIVVHDDGGKENAVRYPRSCTLLGRAALAIALIAPFLFAACSSTTVQTHWTGEAVVTDGVMSEADWPVGTTTYDEKKEYLVGFKNDAENLYIVFRFSNGIWARTIRTSGLVLWLGEEGKRSRELGLRYRGGPMPEARPGQQRDPGQRDMPPGRQGVAPEGRNVFTLILADSDEEIELPTGGRRGPAVASSLDRGVYTYELRIPLVDKSTNRYGIKAQPGSPFTLGVEVAMDREAMISLRPGGGVPGAGQPGGMTPPGGQGGRGGMGGSGAGAQGGMGGSQLSTDLKLWIKTVLAPGPGDIS
jgi:hypothetical protein